jgi:beta-glucanase (GH16 family)
MQWAIAVVVVLASLGVGLRANWTPGGGKQIPGSMSDPSPLPSDPSPVRSVSAPQSSACMHPPALNATWCPAFVGNFSGTRLNTSVWSTCYPWAAASSGCTNFGNHEYEWYVPSQAQVSGGVLNLVAQRAPTSGETARGTPKEYSCRSGMVTTYPSFRFTYGYVQIVARIPNGTGLWPALWLAAADLKWPPEIDMLEHWGTAANARVGLHPSGAIHNFSYAVKPVTANLSAGWHTFALSWTASSLRWFIDGKEMLFLDKSIPQQPMYLIANLADYSAPKSDSGCSGTLAIKSVEVWQPRPER